MGVHGYDGSRVRQSAQNSAEIHRLTTWFRYAQLLSDMHMQTSAAIDVPGTLYVILVTLPKLMRRF